MRRRIQFTALASELAHFGSLSTAVPSTPPSRKAPFRSIRPPALAQSLCRQSGGQPGYPPLRMNSGRINWCSPAAQSALSSRCRLMWKSVTTALGAAGSATSAGTFLS